MKNTLIFGGITTVILILLLSQGKQSSVDQNTIPTPDLTSASISTPLSSTGLTQDEYNQAYREGVSYLNSNPQYKCPDMLTYYNWRLQFYKNNPVLRPAEFSQRSSSLMKQDNYPYWACGIVFLKSYADQLGQYLQQHGYPIGSGLSNNNYYQNINGNTVHSPAYSNGVPAGATAQCSDGTYSFSQHRQGTCSHHGGVAQWL